MDPFPFFLSYFPVTADVLSQELTQLLKDPQRNAWWEEALMLLRQSYEATHVLTYGWDLDGESQLATLVDQLVSSIPEDTDLWRCFGLEPWLRIARVGCFRCGFPAQSEDVAMCPGQSYLVVFQYFPYDSF